jgi:hypothetical protein
MTAAADDFAAIRRLVDESDILRVASEIDQFVDAKEWSKLRSLFDDEVTIELPTIGSGTPEPMRAEDFISAVAEVNFAEKVTYHGRLNHVISIDGDRAELRAHMYGWNQLRTLSPDFFELWGQYQYKLRRTGSGWRVTHLTHIKFHARGNPAVNAAKSL